MMTKILHSMLSRADEIAQREASAVRHLSEIHAAREKVISEASGPDDVGALNKLNVIAAQETIANNSLGITRREYRGLGASILNEATRVRNGVADSLREKHAAIAGRLDKALTPFYPEAKARQKASQSLCPQVEALYEINRRIMGLSNCRFNPREASEFVYAKNICSQADRAIADYLESNK